jgi:hypothetical protein
VVASRYDHLTAEIAANANLVQIYEHAANHPWESPPLISEAIDGVENAPIPKRLLTNPPPPEPPAPELPATSDRAFPAP